MRSLSNPDTIKRPSICARFGAILDTSTSLYASMPLHAPVHYDHHYPARIGFQSHALARQPATSRVHVTRRCFRCAGKIDGTFLSATRFTLQGRFDTGTSMPTVAGSLNRTKWEYKK